MNLRPFKQEDADLLSKWLLDPDYSKFFRNWVVIPSYDDLRNFPNFSANMVLVIEENGKSIGMVVAFDFNSKKQTCEVGIIIEKEFHKSGHGREAIKRWYQFLFDHVNLRKIKVHVVDDWLVKELMEQHGFKFEGVEIEECFHGGKFVNEYRLVLFRR